MELVSTQKDNRNRIIVIVESAKHKEYQRETLLNLYVILQFNESVKTFNHIKAYQLSVDSNQNSYTFFFFTS